MKGEIFMAGGSLNKVLLIGHLGKDPELTYTATGVAVSKFSLATNERWKDENGNVQEKTEWHNIIAWRKLAEICGQYLRKGSKIYLEGKLQTRSWDDKNTGVKRYITEIVADNMIMLDAKNSTEENQEQVPTPEQRTAAPEKDDLPF